MDTPMITSAETSNLFLFQLTALSCIGGFLFGYDTGVISGALVLINDDFDLSDVQQEMIVGMTLVGALISAMTAGYFSDIYGRKLVIIVSSLLFVLGSLLLSVFAVNYTALLCGRLVVGLGVGSASMIMPMYVCEASPHHIRGQMVTYINVAITGGQFISACICGLLSKESHGWEIMLGLAAIPAGIQFFSFFFMPESPRWLIEQARIEEATAVLRRLRGTQDVKEEVQDIVNSIRAENGEDYAGNLNFESFLAMSSPAGKVVYESTLLSAAQLRPGSSRDRKESKLVELWRKISRPAVLRALLVGCALQAAQQFGGINTVMYYSASILKIAGFTSNSEAIWLSVIVSFFNFAGSFVGLLLVDRSGRRRLTLASLGTVCMCLVAIGIAFYLAEILSPSVEVNTGGPCAGNKYCFDCIQDSGCGFCTDIVGYPIPTLQGSSFVEQLRGAVYFGAGCLPTLSTDDDGESNMWMNSTVPGEYIYGCAGLQDFSSDTCSGSRPIGYVILCCLCLYLMAFSPGMGPMPWTINSEIYPTSVRGVANSITTTVNWGSNLIMSMSFLSVISALTRQGAFWTYAGISAMFFLFLYWYLPETLGVPLEAVEELFADGLWGQAATRRVHTTSEEAALSDNDETRDLLSTGSDEQSFYRKLMPSSNLMPSTVPNSHFKLSGDGESLNRAYNVDDSSVDINAVYSTLMRTSTEYDYLRSPTKSPEASNRNSAHSDLNRLSARCSGFEKSPVFSNGNLSAMDTSSTSGSAALDLSKYLRPHIEEIEEVEEHEFDGRELTRKSEHAFTRNQFPGESPEEAMRRHSYDSFVSSGRKDKIRRHLITSVLNPASSIQPVVQQDDGPDDCHDNISV